MKVKSLEKTIRTRRLIEGQGAARYRSSLFVALIVFVLSSFLNHSATAVEKYSATVSDGTAQVIHPGKLAAPEPREEYLEDLASEPQSRLARPTKTLAKPSVESRLSEREALTQEAERTSAPEVALEAADERPALYPNDGAELSVDSAVEETPQVEKQVGPNTPLRNPVHEAPRQQISNTPPAPVNLPVAAAPGTVASAPVAAAPIAAAPLATAPVMPTEKKNFDVVPNKRIPELATRLKYANDILKRWGRAYDYRTTTLTDFKKIVTELESVDEKTQVTN